MAVDAAAPSATWPECQAAEGAGSSAQLVSMSPEVLGRSGVEVREAPWRFFAAPACEDRRPMTQRRGGPTSV